MAKEERARKEKEDKERKEKEEAEKAEAEADVNNLTSIPSKVDCVVTGVTCPR